MKQKDLVTLLALTLIVVIAWVGLNFYNNYTQSTISDTQNLQITPIDPTFDMETIRILRTRERISPNYDINQAAITQQTSQISPTPPAAGNTVTPTPETEPVPDVTTSPEVTTTPEAPLPTDTVPEGEE